MILNTAKEEHYKDLLDTWLIDDTLYYQVRKVEILIDKPRYLQLKAQRKWIEVVKYMGKNHLLGKDILNLLHL